MSSGSGTGGFGRRNRAEWWLRSSHRARVPSGHFARRNARPGTTPWPGSPSFTECAPTAPRGRRRPRPPIEGCGPRRTPRGRGPATSRRAIGAAGGGRGRRPRGRAPRVSLERDLEGHVQDDRDGGAPVALRGLEQLGTRPFLDVRGVDDGQPSAPEAHLEQPMEEVERVIGRALGRGVIGDQRTERVRRENLGRCEVLGGERRLSAGGDADQQDQCIGREDDRRR